MPQLLKSRRMAGSVVGLALAAAALSACGTTVSLGSAQTNLASTGDGSSLGLDNGVSTPSTATGTSAAGTVSGLTDNGATTGTTAGGPSGVPAGATGVATGAGSGSAPVPVVAPHAKIEVGFMVTQDVGGAAKSLGYGGLSTGDGKTQSDAAVNLANAHGGVGGHPITPVVYEASATGDLNSEMAAACASFTQDHHVKAIVASVYNGVLLQCASQHNIPLINSGVSAASNATLRANPLFVMTDQLTYETAARNLVAGLLTQSWFTKVTKDKPVIGLLTHDDPEFKNVEGIVSAQLQAAGLTLTQTAYMPMDNVSQAATAGKAAALKFKAAGVNRVIAVDNHGFAMSWFGIGAGSQGYYPKLGMSTLSEPSLEPAVLTPRQLEGSAGIGWVPTEDTSPTYQQATSPRTNECLTAMKNAGEDMTLAGVRLSSLAICDGTWAVADVWRTGVLTPQSFVTGLKALGTTYQSVIAFRTNFARSRAVPSAYKALAYNDACNCFKYSGGLVTVS